MSYFKRIARKGRVLEQEKLPSRRPLLTGFFGFFKTLLFKNPPSIITFLVLCVALPVSLYITLREGSVISTTQAESVSLEFNTTKIRNLTLNEEYAHNFEVTAQDVEELQFIEIKSPSWFLRGNLLEEEGASFSYKLLTYSGTVTSNTSADFVLLTSGTKTEASSDCKGCDKDSQNVYVLTEFSLNSQGCVNGKVWGRNPVGRVNFSDKNSHCQEFDNECLIPSSWKSFATLEDCLNSSQAPEITQLGENELITFWTDCEGEFEQDTYEFKRNIKASDPDGDTVRFTVDTVDDFAQIRQDDIESIVRKASAIKGVNYPQYEYTGTVLGEISTDMIGKTVSVKVNACDVLAKCSSKTFQISAIKRSKCEFLLPETGNIDLSVSYPADGSDFAGSDDVVWKLTGAEKYDIEVKLFKQSCQESENFVEDVATLEKLSLGEDKGYALSWDSRNCEEGKYCLLILTRDSARNTSNFNWNPTSSLSLNVENDNQKPQITTSPSKTDLVTGEKFEYKVEATDPDGDKLEYEVIGMPNWLKFENQVISGSTVVPGSYTLLISVNDSHKGYDTQLVILNVTPPKNTPSNINFVYPTKNSVLAGEENKIQWEASDNEGISYIELYYSKEGRTMTLVGTYPSGTTEAIWDVSTLENGKYYLRLVVADDSSQKVESAKLSSEFFISNEGEVAGEEISMPAINDLTPNPDSETFSKKPLISASLHASDNAEIVTEQVKVLLDETDITASCEVSKADVFCQAENELQYGKHKVRMSIVDSSDKVMVEEWYFLVVQMGEGTDEEKAGEEYVMLPLINREVRKSALVVAGLLTCISFLLVLIPWLIYFIWSKRKKRRDEVSAPPSTYVPQTAEATPASEFYTPSVYPVVTSDQQAGIREDLSQPHTPIDTI